MIDERVVVRLDALCECQGCGKRFGVELDIGDIAEEFERVRGYGHVDDALDEVVREAMRGGKRHMLHVGRAR